MVRASEWRRWWLFGMLLALAAAPAWASAQGGASGARADEGSGGGVVAQEAYNTGWSFYLDNDLLSLLSRDQQYTGGAALTLSGRRAVQYPWSLDPVLRALDGVTGFDRLYGQGRRVERHSFEFGLTMFTPDNIEAERPIPDDHPYANLVFMTNSQQTVRLDAKVSYQSTFALGLLGTGVGPTIQQGIHELTGSVEPQGWDNQISDGGELTFNYLVNRQQPILLDNDQRGYDYDLRTTVGASVGYTTQVMAGLNWRWGWIRTPWWGFNPDFAEYINMGTPVAVSSDDRAVKELYLWGTLQLRRRFYNAVLEGQFRDSAVTFDRDELESTLTEASVGVTCGLPNGLRATFALRARERELEGADGVNPVWGSLIITQSY